MTGVDLPLGPDIAGALDARQKVAGNKIVDATLEVACERAGKKA